MIGQEAAARAIDDAAVEWIKQHFKDFCAGVTSDGGAIDAAQKRFETGLAQMMRAYDAAQAAIAAKVPST